MAYNGKIITIPLGQGGLRTDDNQSIIPPTHLIEAKNVRLRRGLIEKDTGSRKWNSSALSSGLIGLLDWEPTTVVQRFIAVTRDGKVHRFIDSETSAEVAASSGAPSTLTIGEEGVHLTAGGAETTGRNRKLFIFSGNDPIQVISGDGTTRTDLSSPSADFDTNQPNFGLVHRDRLFVMSQKSHRIFASDPEDHEKFDTGGIQFNVFPGEGDGFYSAIVYKGRLFAFKKPLGVYFLDEPSATVTTWSFKKLSGAFGIGSPHGIIQALDDLIVKNTTGSITGMKAAETFGDIESGDLLRSLRVEDYMRNRTTREGTRDSFALYFEDQKQGLFTYRSTADIKNNQIYTFDFNGQSPQLTINEKDQPNVLALRKDSFGVLQPYYGAEDGFIYEMNREDREINGVGYEGMFQTPHMDMGFADQTLAERMKIWQFLELTYEETGDFDLLIDVYIDREFEETLTFRLTKGAHLNNFSLDTDEVIGRRPQSEREPLHGTGRRISFRCRNAEKNENFRIQALTVYFKIAGEAQTD